MSGIILNCNIHIYAVLSCILFTSAVPPHSSHTAHENDKNVPLVLLLSIDGFRWDYMDKIAKLDKYATPNLDFLVKGGVLGVAQNVFPTNNHPALYSIATGMYVENHGVVTEEIYESEDLAGSCHMNDPRKPFASNHDCQTLWYMNGTVDSWKGEPVWITNEKNYFPTSVRHTAILGNWPGSSATIRGRLPHVIEEGSDMALVNESIKLFADKEGTIYYNFILIRLQSLSDIIFENGPESDKVFQAIVEVDSAIGALTHGLIQANIFNKINIIITAGYGMTEINSVIYLEDYNVDLELFSCIGSNPYLIAPIGGK